MDTLADWVRAHQDTLLGAFGACLFTAITSICVFFLEPYFLKLRDRREEARLNRDRSLIVHPTSEEIKKFGKGRRASIWPIGVLGVFGISSVSAAITAALLIVADVRTDDARHPNDDSENVQPIPPLVNPQKVVPVGTDVEPAIGDKPDASAPLVPSPTTPVPSSFDVDTILGDEESFRQILATFSEAIIHSNWRLLTGQRHDEGDGEYFSCRDCFPKAQCRVYPPVDTSSAKVGCVFSRPKDQKNTVLDQDDWDKVKEAVLTRIREYGTFRKDQLNEYAYQGNIVFSFYEGKAPEFSWADHSHVLRILVTIDYAIWITISK